MVTMGIVPIILRAGTNEVNGDQITTFIWDWQRVKWPSRLGGMAFVVWAVNAAQNVRVV